MAWTTNHLASMLSSWGKVICWASQSDNQSFCHFCNGDSGVTSCPRPDLRRRRGCWKGTSAGELGRVCHRPFYHINQSVKFHQSFFNPPSLPRSSILHPPHPVVLPQNCLNRSSTTPINWRYTLRNVQTLGNCCSPGWHRGVASHYPGPFRHSKPARSPGPCDKEKLSRER